MHYTPPAGESIYFEKDDLVELIANIRGGRPHGAMDVLQRVADREGGSEFFERAKFDRRATA